MEKDLLIFWGTIPWVLFLLVVFFFNRRREHKKKCLKMLFWFVLIFSAIRYGIGYDYFTYKYLISGEAPDYQMERLEIISRYLVIISGGIHYQLFFAVCSFLSLYPVYFVSRSLSIDPLKSFTIYLLFPLLYLDSLGVIRNTVAYSFALLMFYYVYKRQFVISLIIWILAMGFHISAFIAILIYPFYYFCHGKLFNITLYLSSFVLSVILMPILDNYFSGLLLVSKFMTNLDKDITSVGGILYYVINCIGIFHLFFWKKLSSIDIDNEKYLTFVNLGICIWNVFLATDPTTAQRLSSFFFIFIILLAPSYKKMYKNINVNLVTTTFFVLLFISSLGLNLYAYYGKGRQMSNIPYQVFFLDPKDYFYHVD